MKRNWIGFLAVSMALAAGVAYYMNQPGGPLPPSVFDGMKFPSDEVMATMSGDENGLMCQQLDLQTADGTTMIAWHKLWRYDFRHMTVGQKKAALIQGAKDAAHETELACSDPAGKVWLHQAYAQPHCDSCGGGCGSISCPAHTVVGGGCAFGGPNCTISVICCSGGCTCG